MSAFGSDDKNYGLNEMDHSPKIEKSATHNGTNEDQLRYDQTEDDTVALNPGNQTDLQPKLAPTEH